MVMSVHEMNVVMTAIVVMVLEMRLRGGRMPGGKFINNTRAKAIHA